MLLASHPRGLRGSSVMLLALAEYVSLFGQVPLDLVAMHGFGQGLQ